MALTELSMVLWFIFFGFSVIFGIIITRKAFTPDFERSQRDYYLGMAIFIMVHLIARILYFFYDFIYIEDEFFWDLGAIVGIGGIIFLLFAIERYIFTRSKFFFTILAIINVILLIVIPSEYKNIVQTIFIPVIGLFIPIIYFYIAYKGTGNIRKNSLLIAIGILIFLAGQTAHGRTFFEITDPIYLIASPLLMLLGGIIFFYGLVRSS